MPFFRRKVADPPSTLTGPLLVWAQSVADYLNSTPTMSLFSGTSPILSKVTGMPGDLAMNVGSASSTSRLWIHGGTSTDFNTTDWAVIRTLT